MTKPIFTTENGTEIRTCPGPYSLQLMMYHVPSDNPFIITLSNDECVRVADLLMDNHHMNKDFQTAMKLISDLVNTTELNMDSMESHTFVILKKVMQFQNEMALKYNGG